MPLIEMILQAQAYIPGPPHGTEPLWATATRNDTVTVNSWDAQWIRQTKVNAKHRFSENSAMQVAGHCRYQPVILAGSGPSLKKNWKQLVGDGTAQCLGRKGIRIVSCLHNFGFFEDRDVMSESDYYITLDAGEITLGEVTEGGTEHDEDWYWERTKDRTLIAYVGAYPPLIEKWRGRILWFLTSWATEALGKEMQALVDTGVVPAFQVGGNVLGGAMYFARAVLGCSVPIFIGADFAFGYDHKFHGWDSPYDKKFSGVIPWTDIYGNRVWTWGSYFGFKNWFDYMACGGQGGNAQLWINATEGGIMGSYPEGNIQQIIQLDLKTVLHMFTIGHLMPEMVTKSGEGLIHMLF